jgi:hypothetical protein
MIMTAVATVSLAAPSAALAHNGEHHRAGERHHHHRGHHRHAHVLAFHAQAQAPAPAIPTSSPSPTTPASQDKAGTIASFTGGVLTIALNDGSTVSGNVTERTEIECPVPSASAADFSRHDGEDNGDDRGQDENGGPGPSGRDDGDDHGQDNDADDDDAGDQAEHCTMAALVQGASVREAFLSVSSAGATWLKIEL